MQKLLVAVLFSVVIACVPSPQKQNSPPPVIVDLVVDANRNGILDPGDEDGESEWTGQHGAIFLANLDDDDEKADADINDSYVNGDNDVKDLAPIAVSAWPDASDGVTGRVTIDQASRLNIRLFRINGPEQSATSYSEVVDLTGVALTQAELKTGAKFAVEALNVVMSDAPGEWSGKLSIHLEVKDAGGALVGQDDVVMRVAPILFQFNTAPTETIYYSDLAQESRSLELGVDATSDRENYGTDALDLDDPRLEYDQWAQDFFDVGTMSRPGPGGTPIGMHIAIRSPQADRKAGNVVTLRLRGPDFGSLFVHGADLDPSSAGYSMGSFGNWDVIPPHKKGDVDYPLGRVIWGQGTQEDQLPDQEYVALVKAQKVQPEVNIDTSFLSVGHVDEIISFVATNTARGWGLLAARPSEARDMLQQLQTDGHGAELLFTNKYWVDDQDNEVPASISVDTILADADLMAASEEGQIRIDEVVAQLKGEIGLADDEITPMPFLLQSYFGSAVAYQPGTVNLLHTDGHVLIPDPFGPIVNGKDPFKENIKARLEPLGITVFFADDWDLFHRLDGEVHCGTNVARQMTGKWWEAGR